MSTDCPAGPDCPTGGASGSGENLGTDPDGEDGERGEGHEEFGPRVRPSPPEPCEQDKDQHASTGHAVFRSWCGPCVLGRGRSDNRTR